MSQRILKVSALTYYLKSKLDSDTLLQNIIVQGEISNFTNHRSGHWYFTLKDEKSRMNCVMFSSSASKVKFNPKDGDKVLIKCNTSIFEASGQLQLYVTAMKLDGLGDLYLQFEKLKKKLLEEGLFDESHKKMIPKYPRNIGLITGKNTAAREDVISTISRRWPIATIKEFYVLVQGEESSNQLINAIKIMDNLELDVILIVRGGGSIEDLWSFNNEDLARTIYNMSTPIISGVGHEVDITIVDYVSDKRAPTPTGAAEIATPNINEVRQLVDDYRLRGINVLRNKLENKRFYLNKFKSSYVFTNPIKLYEQKQLQLDMISRQLMLIYPILEKNKSELSILKNKFVRLLNITININSQKIKLSHNKIVSSMQNIIILNKESLLNKIQLLDAFSPLKILERGYSLVYLNETLINSVKNINKNDYLTIRLSDGNIKTIVSEVDDGKENI